LDGVGVDGFSYVLADTEIQHRQTEGKETGTFEKSLSISRKNMVILEKDQVNVL